MKFVICGGYFGRVSTTSLHLHFSFQSYKLWCFEGTMKRERKKKRHQQHLPSEPQYFDKIVFFFVLMLFNFVGYMVIVVATRTNVITIVLFFNFLVVGKIFLNIVCHGDR